MPMDELMLGIQKDLLDILLIPATEVTSRMSDFNNSRMEIGINYLTGVFLTFNLDLSATEQGINLDVKPGFSTKPLSEELHEQAMLTTQKVLHGLIKRIVTYAKNITRDYKSVSLSQGFEYLIRADSYTSLREAAINAALETTLEDS